MNIRPLAVEVMFMICVLSVGILNKGSGSKCISPTRGSAVTVTTIIIIKSQLYCVKLTSNNIFTNIHIS